jgi:fructose-1,6-bisphosphatase/inositol monophosphatase family enzyme
MLDETDWAARGHGAYRNGTRLEASNIDCTEAAVICPNGMHAMARERYAPGMMDFLSRFWAVRAVGGALDACMVAAGQVDVWLERKAEVWDLAPLQVILEEAGARYFALDGSRRLDAGNAVGCAPGIERDVRAFFGL